MRLYRLVLYLLAIAGLLLLACGPCLAGEKSLRTFRVSTFGACKEKGD